MKKNPIEVGKRIRYIRTNELGLSMEDFGKKIDDRVKSGTVSNWETGKNLPNNQRLIKIAELGEIPVNELLYGSLDEFAYSVLIDDINNHGRFYNSFKEQFSKLNNIPEESITTEHALQFIEENRNVLINNGVKAHLMMRANSNTSDPNGIMLYDSKRVLSGLIYALSKIIDLPLAFEDYYNKYLKMPYFKTSKTIDEIKIELLKKGKSEKEAAGEAYDRFYISKMAEYLDEFKEEIKDVKKEYDKNR